MNPGQGGVFGTSVNNQVEFQTRMARSIITVKSPLNCRSGGGLLEKYISARMM